jgi:hypothetical protein
MWPVLTGGGILLMAKSVPPAEIPAKTDLC